ncbi:hypothetical protein Hanom_Chr12g01130891 [Helianthus anomalus]
MKQSTCFIIFFKPSSNNTHIFCNTLFMFYSLYTILDAKTDESKLRPYKIRTGYVRFDSRFSKLYKTSS